MKTVSDMVRDFIQDEDGLTVIEYAVAGGAVAVAIAVAFSGFGAAAKTKIDGLFS